jgi:hypothetical protein
MKVNHNELATKADATERSFSILVSLLESRNKKEWNKIPSSDLLIIFERLTLINQSIGDIYKILEKHE